MIKSLLKYDVLESLPPAFIVIVLLLFKLSVPECAKGSLCFNLFSFVATLGATIGYAGLFIYSRKPNSRLAYYTYWQRNRLLVGTVLSAIVFITSSVYLFRRLF